MSKNTIKIDGQKLKALLTGATGKTVYQLAKDNGFSDNFFATAIRSGKASPIVQSVARNYGIAPEAYILKENEPVTETAPETGPGQISITDYTATLSRDELKAIIRETILETIKEFNCHEVRAFYDPLTREYSIKFAIR